MTRWTDVGPVRVEVVQGDITTQQVEAIANAANSSLLGGGGVDGAIHAAAGPALLAECRALRRTDLPDGLPTGDAVATGAGELACRWVIHTVGPSYAAGRRDPALLSSCYQRSLAVADGLGARSIAFPAVSAGVYGWPLDSAATIAVDAVRDAAADLRSIRLVRFVLLGGATLEAFHRALGHERDEGAAGPGEAS
ncbi:MAG: Appr-p processing domain protein [Actinotalea sp.]|nr:Appr-p processing domain protein [Actinotalea sp.]